MYFQLTLLYRMLPNHRRRSEIVAEARLAAPHQLTGRNPRAWRALSRMSCDQVEQALVPSIVTQAAFYQNHTRAALAVEVDATTYQQQR
jgi:hypothetical protein